MLVLCDAKVCIVVFENADVQDVASAEGFAAIAAKGVQYDGYRGVTNPSQFNYFAMVGLQDNYDWHTGSDGNVWFRPSALTIVSALEAAGKTWTIYLEAYPQSTGCFAGNSGEYVRRHNPFISFLSVTTAKAGKYCANFKHASRLTSDIAANQLADYIFYVPDLCNDGHDRCGPQTEVQFMSQYIMHKWIPLLNNPTFMHQRTSFFVFDESGFDAKGVYTTNPIYAVAVGGRHGRVSCPGCNHRNLLATTCHLLGLDCTYLTSAAPLPV